MCFLLVLFLNKIFDFILYTTPLVRVEMRKKNDPLTLPVSIKAHTLYNFQLFLVQSVVLYAKAPIKECFFVFCFVVVVFLYY